MKYELSEYQGKALLKIKENLVTDPDAREFKEVLANLLDSGKKEIIMDFSDIVFIGSSAIGKLLLVYKRLDDMGGKMYIVGLNKDIRDVFITFRLHEFFQIVDDLSQIK